ncbi:putative membrane protein [Desulfosporosinus sp. OT]|nr:putative membrane protein [Desulfosporosinus sp. OT]
MIKSFILILGNNTYAIIHSNFAGSMFIICSLYLGYLSIL